jgi:hypothetical protein
VLAEKYDGRFHNFVKSCSPRLYDNGTGLIDRLVKEFPRFNDVSPYDGETIKIYKLPQLGIWLAYAALRKSGSFTIEDLDKMTAFADYIVPVALRLLGITCYSPELEPAVNTYQMTAGLAPARVRPFSSPRNRDRTNSVGPSSSSSAIQN